MMKILMWVVVAIVIVGGLVWFMSSPETDNSNSEANSEYRGEITESSSIQSDEQVLAEIDNAIEGLE